MKGSYNKSDETPCPMPIVLDTCMKGSYNTMGFNEIKEIIVLGT